MYRYVSSAISQISAPWFQFQADQSSKPWYKMADSRGKKNLDEDIWVCLKNWIYPNYDKILIGKPYALHFQTNSQLCCIQHHSTEPGCCMLLPSPKFTTTVLAFQSFTVGHGDVVLVRGFTTSSNTLLTHTSSHALTCITIVIP